MAAPFRIVNMLQIPSNIHTYIKTNVLHDHLIMLGQRDDTLVSITGSSL